MTYPLYYRNRLTVLWGPAGRELVESAMRATPELDGQKWMQFPDGVRV